MALTVEQRRRLAVALSNTKLAEQIADVIDAGNVKAAVIAALGASTNIPAAACAGGATPAATDVDTAINTCNAVIETRLDAAESKIDALLAALKTAGLMNAA